MFAQTKSTALALASLVLIVACLAMLAPGQTSAVSLPTLSGTFACAKDYMINLVRDRIIGKSELALRYQEAMNNVRERYEQAESRGELAGKDDKELENYYLKLTVEEMRHLRDTIASEYAQADRSLDLSEMDACTGKGEGDDFYDPEAEIKDWSPDETIEGDKEIEAALMTELEELERQASREDEMGWSLTPEARLALKEHTRTVLMDLMQNEARQIAMALLSAYMTGGTSLISVLNDPMIDGIKFKLVQFMINAVTQVVSSIMGRQIEVKPNVIAATTQAPGA